MPYRNKTYVCFDGDRDIHYYRLMQAWHQSDRSSFSFYDAHDLNYARDTSQEASIKAQLRVRLLNTKIFVVLIGEQTRYLRKFVRWEMEQALSLDLPIIGVNLNNFRQQDPDRCPPTIKEELALYVSFRARVLQHALEVWPDERIRLKRLGKTGAFYFGDNVYASLGIAA